jgi:capsular exopolysaccharide synthesis family protein
VSSAPATRDRGLLHRLKVESPLGLEFRRAYLKLRSRDRALPKVLVVTSATRGEGKTTTTACLAITLARELREKVLLVDFDLRSPALHRALGLPSSSWGLAQMLGQRHFDERFVRATVLPNLEFLPAGRSERPAAELIEDHAVEWFVQEASRRYPMVIIDSAPNLAVPDPLILGRVVDGVLYVIKAGSTVRKAAEYGVRVQREARDNLLGVLINDAGEILPQYYGYRTQYYGYTTTEATGADG